MVNFNIIDNINEVPFNHQQSPLLNETKLSDFVDLFPKKLILKIFSCLNSQELTRCFRVNKTWKILASDEALWNALSPRIAFGKKEWETYFGDIGKEPLPFLPKYIHQILKSPCPFWPEKKVEETHTHRLVLFQKLLMANPQFKNLG